MTDNVLPEAELDDTGGMFSFMIGGAVRENMILHFEATGVSLADPSMKFGSDKGTLDGDLTTTLAGVGMTYYFMPANAYISATIGAARTELKDNTLNVVADYIAAGIDPNKSKIFVQSHVLEHAELAWIFNCITTGLFPHYRTN